MVKRIFCNDVEAAALLGVSIERLKELAREGMIREFRDGGAITYKETEQTLHNAGHFPAQKGCHCNEDCFTHEQE